jgi:hypothetical protein
MLCLNKNIKEIKILINIIREWNYAFVVVAGDGIPRK